MWTISERKERRTTAIIIQRNDKSCLSTQSSSAAPPCSGAPWRNTACSDSGGLSAPNHGNPGWLVVHGCLRVPIVELGALAPLALRQAAPRLTSPVDHNSWTASWSAGSRCRPAAD